MNESSTSSKKQEPSLRELLGNQGSRRSSFRWLWLLLAAAVVAGAGFMFINPSEDITKPKYVTETASVSELVVKVSATGNLQPTNQVEVGSELSGIIEHVYVDVNDKVDKGQVLARLDLSKLKDTVAKSRANLAMAKAQVLQTQATVAEVRAELGRFRQVAKLSGGKVPSKSEMDAAVANLSRAEANEANARANVTQAMAALQSTETDFDKASIRSPINGVVLTRKVEPGQTVAASFQAPILFTLAEDLAKMELQVAVDEADVGQVREGQRAAFGVDAWPGRQYDAVITRISYGSQEKDGVISYLTLLEVNNSDLTLRPGMTATAEIITLTHENALLVPNAALRFTPPETVAQKKKGSNVLGTLMPRMARQPAKVHTVNNGVPRVWILSNGQPVPVEVHVGASNGRVTEITAGAIEAGTEVVTEIMEGSS